MRRIVTILLFMLAGPVAAQPDPACPEANPVGCFARGACPGDRVCMVTETCVPSACACDAETGVWVCEDDCDGGECVQPCTTPNPAGCTVTGCPETQVCNTEAVACRPAACLCVDGDWVCGDDCDGGVCGEPPHQAEHFASDPVRNAIVDDRGGRGVGYRFVFDSDGDPENYGRFDSCPHCSFAVMVADPGLDLDQLAILGIDPLEYESLVGLADAVEQVIATDPEELAMMVRPDLSGEDLAAYVAEVMRVIGVVQGQIARLRTVERLKMLQLEFGDFDLDSLEDDLGLALDSAFRADFDNPNNPKKNSGIRVYGLEAFLTALVGKVSDEARDRIAALLSDIPDLPGDFEMSGDDQDPLDPAFFHGIHTGLKVEYRSYAVTGQNAILHQFTLVNDSRRVLPFVHVGMISDADLKPASRDDGTDYDAVTGTALVHDEHPYADEPTFFAVGSAPSRMGSPRFVPSNYNLDDRLSLSQFAPSIEANRKRFFLWHPDVSGDHDDVDARSEKQIAVAMLLDGPLMPGERARVAFCYAGAKAGSAAAARAEMLATMTACQALDGLLNAACGDGALQVGEVCDDGNTADGDGCSAECTLERCGDGRKTGAEECDDGNTESDDGCTADCRTERCGDGIRQANEACDDGDEDDTDACRNDCTRARCGDGVLRRCDPDAGEDCSTLCDPSLEYCLRLTLDTETLVPGPRTGRENSLAPLAERPVELAVSFDVDTVEAVPGPQRARRYLTGGVTVRFADRDFDRELGPALAGHRWAILLTSGPGGVSLQTTDADRIVGRIRTVLELRADRTPLGVDETALPVLMPFAGEGAFEVRRTGGGTLAESASGGAMLDLVPGAEAVATPEQCDDGNANDHDDCLASCQRARCGDGVVWYANGETCDEGEANGDGACTAPGPDGPGCRAANPAACGDGNVDPGEECDDADNVDGDGCSALCQTERCGDGVVQAGEECDDGNAIDGDGCTAACAAERCGDGVVQLGERCDDGDVNADGGACLPDCTRAACGDGRLLLDGEECDDANLQPGDGCAPDCTREVCGDGRPGPGEACDDGNRDAFDGCGPTCQLEGCGDGVRGPGEQCDDGNALDGDGCDKDCALENPEACGDGVVGPGEQCDDGGTADGDGCDAVCRLEDPAACGDGDLDPGEQCDDGNTESGDGCSRACGVERCGDAIQQPGEACDDGNTAAGDGCAPDCSIEPTTCGDGVQGVGEQCDDGNTEAGDGCDGDCRVEDPTGPTASCGDGTLDRGESCDDGDRDDGDGCDAFCQVERGVCGNGGVERGEACDDGNTEAGDGCDAMCQLEAVCGDGQRDFGEACDDGNTNAGDGCGPRCKPEAICGDGRLDPGEACDDGNVMAGDGCSGGCQVEAVCGDGSVDATEGCDDGNTDPGDGCDATCRVEMPGTDEGFCGDGIVQPGEACDPAEEQAPGAAEYRLRPCNDDCTERKEGCGCRATDGAPGGAVWLLLVGLWGLRRRRG